MLGNIILVESYDGEFGCKVEIEEELNPFTVSATHDIIIRIPIERIDNDNFVLGLCHELIEATLVVILREQHNMIIRGWCVKLKPLYYVSLCHFLTLLSLPKYDIVRDQAILCERGFEGAKTIKGLNTRMRLRDITNR